MKGLTGRFFTILFVVLFSFYLLVPSVLKFGFGKNIPEVAGESDPWYYHIIPSEVLKLGLDLRGGLHLVLGIDFVEVEKDAAFKLKSQLQDLAKQEKIDGLNFESIPNNRVKITYPNDAQWEKFDSVIGRYLGPQIDFESQSETEAVVRMSSLHQTEVRDQAIEQAVETLRNRIDEFGIAEPIITKQGTEKILVQFPGVQETGRLKDIISRTAKLSFNIVRVGPEIPNGYAKEGESVPSLSELEAMVSKYRETHKLDPNPENPISLYLREMNTALADQLPKGTEILFHKDTNINTREMEYVPYLLDSEPMVTGEDLQDASQTYNPENNLPEVNFEMTPIGAGKFEQATGNNVGQFMAIVLDQNVHSAPRINTKIGGGRARIEMGSTGRAQDEVLNDAKDTALVLRSGALPARLLFLEERVIGPSLGAEAIRSGSFSLSVGLILVLCFLLFYYKLSGVVAGTALAFNGLIVFSVLAAFEGTLTLPGLAGLALTLGMAVDANVLIFEHMREELRNGKSVNLSIAEGYKRAFSAILDGNITTLIAAMVLLQFGYGPIRGFAVTLIIGIVASVFTAVYVTRFIFDYFVVSKSRKALSI